MDFGTAIKTCFSKYAVFAGRAARSEYWYFCLFNILIGFALFFAALFTAAMIGATASGGIANHSSLGLAGVAGLAAFLGIFVVLVGIYALAVLLPSLGVTVRRFHDLNVSGWFLLLFMVLACIPVINFFAGLAQLIWFCMPGTSGTNKYGPDPLAETTSGA